MTGPPPSRATGCPPVGVFVIVLVALGGRLPGPGRPVVPASRARPSSASSSSVAIGRRSCEGCCYTGTEAVVGLAIGVALGTAAGFATARWASAREVLLPVAIGASTIPIIAFAPITINWFGSGEPRCRGSRSSRVMVFFPIMVNTIRGLTNVDPGALELMSSYAAGDRRTSCASCASRTRCRTGSPLSRSRRRLSVIGAVVGEFFGGPLYALGIYITLQTGASKYPSAWAAIVLACVLGIVLYLAAVALERLAIPWYTARETAR